jgi:hypothetical protein
MPTDMQQLPRQAILRSISANPSLYDVGQRLALVLERAGFSRHSFYPLQNVNGFALVAMLEHITPNGRPIGRDRWTLPEQSGFDWGTFIASLVAAPTGYYRIIVFVVTDQPLKFQGTMSGAAAEALARRGRPLDQQFRSAPFSGSFQTTALIYEYQKIDAHSVAPSPRGRITANAHLDGAGISSALVR